MSLCVFLFFSGGCYQMISLKFFNTMNKYCLSLFWGGWAILWRVTVTSWQFASWNRSLDFSLPYKFHKLEKSTSPLTNANYHYLQNRYLTLKAPFSGHWVYEWRLLLKGWLDRLLHNESLPLVGSQIPDHGVIWDAKLQPQTVPFCITGAAAQATQRISHLHQCKGLS